MDSYWMKKAKMHLRAIAYGSFVLASAYGTYKLGKTLKDWIQRTERKQIYEMEDYIQHKYIQAEKLQQQQQKHK
uniref:Uncharacterized protein n=1 Tax=Panagrolaimus sp. PS1159 TaxID=55785 RepID=A0AC35EV38_9BILA